MPGSSGLGILETEEPKGPQGRHNLNPPTPRESPHACHKFVSAFQAFRVFDPRKPGPHGARQMMCQPSGPESQSDKLTGHCRVETLLNIPTILEPARCVLPNDRFLFYSKMVLEISDGLHSCRVCSAAVNSPRVLLKRVAA